MSEPIRSRNRIIVTRDGARLRTRSQGDSALPPILFLHGGGGTLEDFDALAPLFEDHHRVLFDTRGHGGSTLGHSTMTYPLLAEDAEAVISEYELDAPIVIGHSDGGIAAFHVALRKKHRLKAIVTIGSDAETPANDTMALFEAMTADKWREKFPDGVAVYEELNPEADFDRFFASLRSMWMDASEGNYPGSAVAAIDRPTLILAGDRDHLAPPAGQLSLSDMIPGAHFGLVPFATHIVHQERPDYVERFVRDLLLQL